MPSKAKPPIPPKPPGLLLNHTPIGSQTKKKEPPPTLPKPQRRLTSSDDCVNQESEQCGSDIENKQSDSSCLDSSKECTQNAEVEEIETGIQCAENGVSCLDNNGKENTKDASNGEEKDAREEEEKSEIEGEKLFSAAETPEQCGLEIKVDGNNKSEENSLNETELDDSKESLEVSNEDEDNSNSFRRSRSSNSSLMQRNDYRRRAFKRIPSPNPPTENSHDNVASSPAKTNVPKSKSTNIPPATLPKRKKLHSCPPSDTQLSNAENGMSSINFQDLEQNKSSQQSPPVSSDDEDVSESSSSEDEEKSVKDSPKKPPKSFLIAKELMTTERTFVDCLKLLNDDLKKCVEKANKQAGYAVIPPEVYNRIFGSFPQLYNLNLLLLQELEHRIEHWDETPKIADILVKHGPFLKLYTYYFKNYSQSIADLEEACKKYPLFNDTLKYFELTDRCKKLEIKHYMLKPVQRIPQYRLLLLDYLKHLDESSLDYANTQGALSIVSEVAEHANETMKESDKFAKLLQIQNTLGEHQIVKPGRTFLREGDLNKLCRKGMRCRRFYLFNDCLLHCSLTPTQGLFRLHHELPLCDMKVYNSKPTDSQTEFRVVSVARSFILAASSKKEKEDWLEALNDAIAQNEAKRRTFLQAKLQNQVSNSKGKSLEKLGEKAPVWTQDTRVTMCQICMREFTLTFRRHHCRACGKVVCSLCSAYRAPLAYLKNQKFNRVCYECYHILWKDFENLVRQKTHDKSNKAKNLEANGEQGNSQLLSPSLEDLRVQFKQLGALSGEPRKIHVPKVLQEVSACDSNATTGYLNKKAKKGWKRLWFVVKDNVLYTYKASEDIAALESTPLLGFSIKTFETPIEGIHPSLIFELYHKHLSMIFYADTENSAQRWLEAFRKATILK